ncbi:glycoside hydrolase family 55 protein [Luteolibacter sp. GHJ8]|uniref:Glycoside hydrolase family 55 protein n=1 Tax=Luteolibacter rhizosphaerae TaxID=2989719 RepID=A0ABT3FZR9_9BACT|nr:glycoside hydrolase family 55 protein [Luteolibacter rhizosphaerae]MCW1912917.1 glycoside hydrolase family 55 protein [Luteolibacter rhizosphaerae]
MKHFTCIIKLAYFIAASAAAADGMRFPDDPAVIDAKRHFGAKGDGKTDDTDALQRAIDASCGMDPAHRGKSNALFVPDGTYRLTRSLVVKSPLGPWLYGESRDGVVLKLDGGVKGVTSVLRTHPNEKGPTSADWFMRNLRHFTIDVGNNPTVDGIRYYATNSGCLKDVRLRGRGKIGVNAGFLDQSGPNLVQDVEIDGFETGVLSQWIWGQTLSRVTIRNARKVGVVVSANVVAIEDLKVDNTPLAIDIQMPNDWAHWCGVVALQGGTFRATGSAGPAIANRGVLYARDITSDGYRQLLAGDSPAGTIEGKEIDEFVSAPGRKLFDATPLRSLGLPVKREPVVPWEHDPGKWLCADDCGAVAGDGIDDSDAIQKAMDRAAAEGKTVIYFRGCGGGDPNWFTLSKPVRVPKPVRLVTGLGWARILGDKDGAFFVDDDSVPRVKFQNLDSFGGPPVTIMNASASNTLLVESCGVTIVGDGGGDIFTTDCPAHLHLKKAGQKCWARQLNPEGASDTGLVRNDGADLWCLGIKHEGRGVRFATTQGGRTEILGLFNYGGTTDEMDPRPSFVVEDASFSVAGMREIAFDQHTALNKVRERRGNETRLLDKHAEGGWIAWPLFSGFK